MINLTRKIRDWDQISGLVTNKINQKVDMKIWKSTSSLIMHRVWWRVLDPINSQLKNITGHY